MKKIDNIFRFFSLHFLPKRKLKHIEGIKEGTVLIIRPGGAGDAILLTPALKILKEKLPLLKIHFLGERRNIEFAKLCYGNLVDQFFIYDSLSYLSFVIKNLGKYDLVIDTEQFFVLPAIFARVLGKTTVGFSTKSHFLDFSVDYFHFSFEAFEFFRLFYYAVGILSDSPKGFEDIERMGKEFRRFFSFSPDGLKKYDIDVVVAPFTTKREKSYDGFSDVIDILSKKYKTVVLGNKKIDVYELLSLVNSSRVFVGVDNAILHLAELLGKPCVAIFGPTNHLKWTYNRTTKVVRVNTWCSPCSYFAEIPDCPRNVECMKKINPSEVVSIVESLLKTY